MGMVFHWPQVVCLSLSVLSVVASAALHGKPRTGNYNVMASLTAIGVWVWLLYEGGFFVGVSP